MEEADEQSASREPAGQREDCKSDGTGELEDELDIYKDIECSSPVGENKEPQSVSNLLPPPPEPPRMLVDFGKSDLSVDMDDSISADICRKGSDDSDCGVPCALNSPILESEIYDPAEPCMDSDDEIPVKPIYKALEEDIPLPPGSPAGKLEESRTNVVSYSSTDSSGCESESGVKLKLGAYETSGQPTRELLGEEGGLRRLRPQTPTSPECQTVSEEVLGIKVGENSLRHPDARLSDTPDDEKLQKADESRVTNQSSITDDVGRQSKSYVEICKVCSKASGEGDSELLGVCNCGGESNSVRKRKGPGVNISSTSSSLESSSCSSSSSSNSVCSSSSDSSDVEHSDKAVACDDPTSDRDSGHKKKRKKKKQNFKGHEENVDTDGDFQLKSKRDKFCTGTSVLVASGKGTLVTGEMCNNVETDLIGSFDKSSVRNIVENSLPDPAAQLGLEGLDTESISENEAFNFDDYCSQSDNDRDSGEIDCAPLRKKRKLRNKLSGSRQSASKSDIFKELDENISVPKLDWNSEEDVGKKVFDSKEDRMMERKGKKYEKENATSDGTEVSKKNNFDKKSKKISQTDIVSSIECKDNTISWKKISLEGKERNYRDSKLPRSGEKEKEYHSVKGMLNKKEKKMKEKRKDIERYDVRKVLNDKRKIGDRFGRDQSREYSFSRSRSRSNGLRHSRSRSASRSKARSPNRYRHRSKSRSCSRSYKSRRRLKNKTGRKSKDRSRESFSREKRRKQRSRSRNRRGSKSRSRSRSWNRSRSRSVIKSRKRQERGRNSAKSSQRMRNKRSWSRTWTPSWSRSRSGSTTSTSFSRSCSPPPRKFTRSFTHSFSRSWSREPHEHIPVPKASTLVKSSKKHSVILTKPKDEEHHVKKGKKKKDSRAEKNKKRKERLIPPSKEVFTSGDNILVSVNFNKSTRSSGLKSGGDSSILGSSCLSLPSKITSKHSHLDENFEITKELTKKPKKEVISGDKKLEEGTNIDNAGDGGTSSKQKKKVKKSLKEDKRFAALLKQKPIAVIDLDHSPFKERTPSPADLIVLSDSNEEAVNNDSKGVAAENTSNPELSLDIPSPPDKTEMVHGRVSDLSVTTGPKTPPEPPSERNLQGKGKSSAVTVMPSRDDDSIQPSEKDEFEEHSGKCPAPQENPTIMDVSVSSPGAYDPFDPTKSATPSPGGQESGVDAAAAENLPSSVSGSHHAAEEGNSRLTGDTPEVPDNGIEVKASETSAECVSMTNSEQGSATSISLDPTKESPKRPLEENNKEVSLTELKLDVNNTVVNMEIDETDGLVCTRLVEGVVDKDQSTTQAPGGGGVVVTTTVTQISTECLVTSVRCNETPVKPDSVSNNLKLQMPLVSTPVKPLQQVPPLLMTPPPRSVAFLQIPPPPAALSTPMMIHQPMLSAQPKLPPVLMSTPVISKQPPVLMSTPVISKQPDCPVGPFNMSVDQGLFLTSTPLAKAKDGGAGAVPNISNISAIANYLVNSLATTPQNTPLLKQLNISADHTSLSLASIPTPPAHNGDRRQQKTQDTTEVVDMDLDSPYSPASSEGDDLFEPPPEMVKPAPSLPAAGTKLPQQSQKPSKPNRSMESNVLKPPMMAAAKPDPLHSLFSSIAKSSANKPNLHTSSKGNTNLNKSKDRHAKSTRKEIHIKRAADQLEILDELPSSAVELQVKEKFLKKLNRQERVVDEVKIALKPHYTKKYITKEEYKDILRRAVPKICHNEPGEINPAKVGSLIEAYVKKYRYAKKKFGSHGDRDRSKTVM